MIIPAGKRRHQVNQGGLKHESIFNSSWFNGVMSKQALAPSTFEQEDKGQDVDPKLQQTMSSGGLDPARQQAMPEGADGVGKGNPAAARPGMGEAPGANPAQDKDPISLLEQAIQSGQIDATKARDMLSQVQQHDPNEIKNVVNQALRQVDQTGLLQALLQEKGDGQWVITISNRTKVSPGGR